MKKLIVLIAILFAFSAGCAHNIPVAEFEKVTSAGEYSFQGPLNPNEFVNWQLVHNEPVMTPMGLMFDVFIVNPDADAPIRFANPVVAQNGIVGYYFIYNEEFYSYQFNNETMCYERCKIDEEVLGVLKKQFEEHFGIKCS